MKGSERSKAFWMTSDGVGLLGVGALDNFDDVEAEVNAGIAELAEVIEGGFAEVALFLELDGFAGRAEFLGLAGLDLDEDEPVLVAGDEIDLGFAAAEIPGENLVAATAEVFGGGFLAAGAEDLARGAAIGFASEPTEKHSE